MRAATTPALGLLVIVWLGASPALADLVVVDPEGAPVAGAAVEVRTAPDGDDLLAQIAAPVQTTETATDGKAHLSLPAVTTLVTVDHPTHAPWTAEISPEDHLTRIRLAPGGRLPGTVVAASTGPRNPPQKTPTPKEGTVCASWRDERPRWGITKAWTRCAPIGDDGSFEIAGLPLAGGDADPIELSVQAPGYLPLRREIDTRPSSEPLKLELERGVLITGRVESTTGEPLRNSTVRDAAGGAEAPGHPDGTFEIAVDSLPATLAASAPGYRSHRVRIPQAPPKPAPRIVQLEPAERVTGVLLGDDAAPPPAPRLAWELHAPHAQGRRETGRFEIDSDDGSFGFDLPRPGTYLLTLEADGYRDERLPELYIDPGAIVDLGVLELSRGAGVRGTVVDSETGDPLPGVSISLLPTGPALFRASEKMPPAAVTDDEGGFALLGVEGGRYQLRARHDRYATYLAPVTIHRDEAETLDPIALDAGTTVRVHLVDRAGEPRSSLALRIREPGAEVLLPVAEGLSDAEGWVADLTLAAGSYRAEVNGERLLLAQELEVPADEDEIELELTVAGVDLTGRVLRAGEPVPGGTLSLTSALDPGTTRGKLTLHAADGRTASYGMTETGVSAAISPDGTFRIADAPAGVLLATWSGGGETVQRELLVPDLPRAEVEIELGGLPLTGRTVTEDGAPVPEADIVVTDASGRVVGQVRTGPGGSFTIENLSRDRYTLEASAPGYASTTRPDVQLTETSAPIVLTMEPGGDGSLDVTLTRADGSPLAGDLISLLDRGGRVVRSLVADGRGNRRFEVLPAGEYFVVWSDALAGVGHSPAIRVRGGVGETGAGGEGTTTWNAALPEGSALVIACGRPECAGAPVQLLTVHSAEGLPLGWALPGMSAGLRLSGNGEVALGRLAPGTYQVSLWTAGHRWEVPVRVVSGTPARLVVD